MHPSPKLLDDVTHKGRILEIFRKQLSMIESVGCARASVFVAES